MTSETIRFDLQSEKAVLGGCLKHGSSAVALVRGMLSDDAFHNPLHTSFWKTMCQLADQNRTVEPSTVDAELATLGHRTTKSLALMDELLYFAPSKLDAIEDIAKRIASLARDRKVEWAAKSIVGKAHDRSCSSDELREFALTTLHQVTHDGVKESLKTSDEIAVDFWQSIESAQRGETGYVKTGLDLIDQFVGGLHAGHLTILAARPAMGKTALAIQLADIYANANQPVLLFSLEMPNHELFQRVVSQRTGISSTVMRSGKLTKRQIVLVQKATHEISKLPITWDDTGNRTINELRAHAMRVHGKQCLGLIVVDYLQKIKTEGKRKDTREQEVAEVVVALKNLAKELRVPVLALAQINRGAEGRPEKRPSMADIRESGAIETEADLIMLMYREEYYSKGKSKKPEVCEIIVDKNRHGATGTYEIGFKRESTRFYNCDQSVATEQPKPTSEEAMDDDENW